MRRLSSALLLVLVIPVLTVQAQQGGPLANLKTAAEASGYKSTSTYAEVVAFMETVDKASPLIHLTNYGTTSENRAMPMAVVGTGLKDASVASVMASGKLRVHIQGNIHAGEVEGKESTLILLREFAQGQHADWLQSMVFLITPIFNADGNERYGLRNRPRQNGPINGMGTRANGQNININRDFMKLETPEGRAFVKLWNDYNPHVGMDLHTSDGSTHGYHLTYSPPLNPNTSDFIMNVMKNEWFPFVTEQIRAKHKWETFYYGNVSNPGGGGRGGQGRGGAAPPAGSGAPPTPPTPPAQATPAAPAGPRAWGTFEHVPRFHNNYVGMRNRFALLSEAYAYATFEDRIKATNYFIEEAMNFAHRNAAKIRKAVEDADREAVTGKTMATRARIKTGGMIEILMGEVEDEKNPIDGGVMNRRKDVILKEQMTDRLWFEPTETATAPSEYYIPASATKALELLRHHGIMMKQTTAPVTGLQQYTIATNVQAAPRAGIDINGHALRTLTGTWAAGNATAPAGSWLVPMNQPLARLAFYLLEPNSDDGVTTWNFLDEMLGEGVTVYPILRK
jgi:murein tripeptide amidase MpaA